MPGYKGSALITLKKIFRKYDAELEKKFISSMTPEELAVYERILPSVWYPIDTATSLYEKAVKVLYPVPKQGLVEIGKEIAVDNLNSVYRVLVRVATAPYVIKQAALFWKTYHQKGQAWVENISDKKLIFNVRDYPELPVLIREMVRGFIIGLLEQTKAFNVQVTQVTTSDDPWKWEVTWS